MKKFDLDNSLNVIHGGVSDCAIADPQDSYSYEAEAEKFVRKLNLHRMKKHRVFRPEDFVLYAVILKVKEC